MKEKHTPAGGLQAKKIKNWNLIELLIELFGGLERLVSRNFQFRQRIESHTQVQP